MRLTFDSEGTTGGLIHSPPLGSEVTISCSVPCCLPQDRFQPSGAAISESILELMMRLLDDASELDGFLRRPRWQARSACRNLDTREFFPEGTGLSQDVRRICAACPVSVECLTFALADPSLKGVWAGTTERGRGRIRAAMRRESAGLSRAV